MIWLLLITYQVKHFLCDYPLQGRYMLGKFKSLPDCLLPLAAHGSVHGVATFLIALMVKPKIAFWVAILDMLMHGVIDYIKANPALGGRFEALTKAKYVYQAKQYTEAVSWLNANSGALSDDTNQIGFEDIKNSCEKNFKSNTYFWWSIGADQFAHHLTHYFLIWCLL